MQLVNAWTETKRILAVLPIRIGVIVVESKKAGKYFEMMIDTKISFLNQTPKYCGQVCSRNVASCSNPGRTKRDVD